MARVIFTTHPGVGHFHPQVPLALALRDAGHEVAFACARSFCPVVSAAGFPAFSCGLDWLATAMVRAFPELTWMTAEQGSRWIVAEIFAGRAAASMSDDLTALASAWRADLIVRDPWEFGGCLAAERLGLPHASAGAGMFSPPGALQEAIGEPLAALRRRYGLTGDSVATMLRRYVDLAFAPPSLLTDGD